MSVIHVNYRSLRNFRFTYHPPEEIRVQREINRLKVDRFPFGGRKIPHISQNAQVRILEQATKEVGLPHPRFLNPNEHFKIKLNGWMRGIQGLYKYYRAIRPSEQNEHKIIDFMLDYLGFERLEDLPLSEQIKMLSAYGSRIQWDYVSKAVKRKLIERLTEEVGLLHPRMLSYLHFGTFELPEIGSTLIGLCDNYRRKSDKAEMVIEKILDDIGIPKFDQQSWEDQLKCLKQCKSIQWDKIPKTTQLKLLKMLMAKLPMKNGLPIPHLRVLIVEELERLFLEEIGTSLLGLLRFYRSKIPKDFKGTSVDYMLDQLGIEKFAELSYEEQCLCLRYNKNYNWDRVSKETILRLVERIKEILSLPHLRFLDSKPFREVVIPEIDQPLNGLYVKYQRERVGDDPRTIADIILDDLGVEPFSEMPFALQLQWTRSKGFSGWKRVSDPVISFYLEQLTDSTKISRRGRLLQTDFSQPVAGKEGLWGLYLFLQKRWSVSQKGEKMLDWALREYGLNLWSQIQIKRRYGSGLLDPEEKLFLIQQAQAGSREAQDHLIFFYSPLIKSVAWGAGERYGSDRKSFDELVQIGRISFLQIVKNYNPSLSRFETYVNNSLPWYIFTAIIRDSGVIHRPVYHLEKMRKINKTAYALKSKLGRSPTDEELAQALGMSVAKLHIERSKFLREVSLEQPIGSEDDFTIQDTIVDDKVPSPEEKLRELEFKKTIQQAIEGSKLNKKQKIVLRERWLNDLTLEETKETIGVTSRERVRQIEAKAFKKIQKGPYANILKSLLED